MSNTLVTHTKQKPSKLDQFSLGFELNKTWAEARNEYASAKKK